MASLFIRDFPEYLRARLKSCAALEQIPLYELIIAILAKAIEEVEYDGALSTSKMGKSNS
jgi:hypothetical protein